MGKSRIRSKISTNTAAQQLRQSGGYFGPKVEVNENEFCENPDELYESMHNGHYDRQCQVRSKNIDDVNGDSTNMEYRRSPRQISKLKVPQRIQSLFQSIGGEPSYSKAKMKIIFANPNVYLLKDFLTATELDYFDKVCTAHENSFVNSFTQNENNEQVFSTERTSTYFYLSKAQDHCVRSIEQRAADLVGLSSQNVEPLQIVSYTDGQKFEVHHDAGTLDENGNTVTLVSPARYVTLFIYLNDLPEGEGETEFPLLNLKVRPQRGCGVMFCNVLPDGEADVRTIHQANSVSSGLRKYGVNIWLCEISMHEMSEYPPTVSVSKIKNFIKHNSALTKAQMMTSEFERKRDV